MVNEVTDVWQIYLISTTVRKKVVFISINDYDDYLPIQWYGMNITDRTQMVISLSLSSRISPSTFQYLIFRDHHLLNTTIIFA